MADGDKEKLKALTCESCSAQLKRAVRIVKGDDEDDEDEEIPIAKCTSCGKEYDQHTQVYYELFADTFTSNLDKNVFALGLKGEIEGKELRNNRPYPFSGRRGV